MCANMSEYASYDLNSMNLKNKKYIKRDFEPIDLTHKMYEQKIFYFRFDFVSPLVICHMSYGHGYFDILEYKS